MAQDILMMSCLEEEYPKKIQTMKQTYSTFRKVCLDRAKFHVHLSRLGYTPLDSMKELSLLDDQYDEFSVHDFPKSKVFLFDSTQLEDHNEARNAQFLRDMESFLDMNSATPLSMHTSSSENKRGYKEKLNFDICKPEYDKIRRKLLQVGSDASTWIQDYFIKSSHVVVPNKDRFIESIEKWKVDPCSLRK